MLLNGGTFVPSLPIHLAVYGVIFGCHNCGGGVSAAMGICWVEASNAAKSPTMHRAVLSHEELSISKCQRAEVEKSEST